MKNFSAFQIYELLKNQVVSKALKGTISVKFADVEFNVETKDIMGGIPKSFQILFCIMEIF